MKTCQICSGKIPSKIKIDGKTHVLSSRKYCLKCSPFNNHNTKQLHILESNSKHCKRCNEIKPMNDFYVRKNTNSPTAYCKICTNIQVILRQRSFKKKCVEYKGGSCEYCGYNKSIVSLEFHHIDPSKKDFAISKSKAWKFNKKIIDELDKCQLLCKSCHAEEHERICNIRWKMVPSSGIEPEYLD